MDFITLNNAVTIPQLGLGVFQTPEGEQTENAVRWALANGYRHIDTAKVYGNEDSVGKAIAESDVDRKDIFLTTKLWNEDIRQHRAKEAFEESLARLGTDYVDLYLIHWPADGWQDAWQAMVDLYHEGRIRAIGVSNFQIHHLEELAGISDVVPAANQIESSPDFPNDDVIDYCKKHGITVEAWSPLGGTGGGLLKNPALAEIGAKYGKSAAQVVIRWHLQRGVVVIPKSVHENRIRQNIDVFDFTLTDEDMAAVEAAGSGVRNGANPDTFDF
ncbi:aldo/keto reductase [Bifidobacterium vansinderenii]|uniref:Glyoxal reductase n=1 Tax=Bifidobacterium vansinderenii TaxID=1984871 RepID=A0A229VV81_9BIFI|nr:aldo/keto reductase [Bifidobacterium vansinderenii]OXM99518.1 glyoxal reductase [Bifidobacterium vansinderenii]